MTEQLSPSAIKVHQREMTSFIIDNPRCALWAGMSLGKTVSTLTAIKHLIDQLEARRILIIAPLRVAKTTWPREIAKWSHMNGLSYSIICGIEGQTTPKKRAAALRKNVDLYFINRENTVWLLDELDGKWPFDMIVIDESSSFKNHSSKRFKYLKRVSHLAARFVELTGTPAPKNYMNIWPQIFLLDQGGRLGRTITDYRNRWFRFNQFKEIYELMPGAEEEIQKRISDLVLVQKTEDYIDWPEPEHRVISEDLPFKAREQYRELEKEFILKLEDAAVVEAVNAAVLSGKLRQGANGAFYTDESRKYSIIHDVKLEALDGIIERHRNESILVSYAFKSDKERILDRYAQAEALTSDPNVIDRWNARKIPILVAHPASAGHGLNLQFGGRIVVWFGDTWDLELYLQFNARLPRLGQTEKVLIYHIRVKNTVDDVIAVTLEDRDLSQKQLLNALKSSIKTDNMEYKIAS